MTEFDEEEHRHQCEVRWLIAYTQKRGIAAATTWLLETADPRKRGPVAVRRLVDDMVRARSESKGALAIQSAFEIGVRDIEQRKGGQRGRG